MNEAHGNALAGASPTNTAAHAAAILPRIQASLRGAPGLSTFKGGDYSSRMNLRGLSATPFTRTS